MKSSKLTVIALAFVMACGAACAFIGCGSVPDEPHTPITIDVDKTDVVVRGYEWGPAIPKIIVGFKDNVGGIDKDTFSVSMRIGASVAKRSATAAYACDENGEKTTSPTKYAAVEMSVKYNEANPFRYSMETERNSWAEKITVTVTVNSGKSFSVGTTKYADGDSFVYEAKDENRRVPQTQSWVKDSVVYDNDEKEITLSRAAWAPDGAASDGGKNPLIIWLHGAGEGGTDIDITLLGNEVTALTTENDINVQHYFANDGCKGAYVLAVQAPTMWMDDGTGKLNDIDATGGKQLSCYTGALWKAITTYVDGNSDIDTNRIYIGGCSNGGYMTVNLMLEHPDYFAAYYPICQAYRSARITDEMLDTVKDCKIWFALSEDDNQVNPHEYTFPLYRRFIEAGAKNVHLTVLDHVYGVDDPKPSTSGYYYGHWSWITVLNDGIKTQLDNAAIHSVDDMTADKCTASGNLWEWLAAQTK